MKCPKCRTGKLQAAAVKARKPAFLGLGGGVLDLQVDQCPACGGAWFDAGELERYLGGRLASLGAVAVDPKRKELLDSKIGLCPRCVAYMVKVRAPGNRKAQADACPQCRGFWLDAGEFPTAPRRTLGDRLAALFGKAKRPAA